MLSDNRSTRSGLPVVDLDGSPRIRGLAHGEALRVSIARGIELWSEEIRATIGLPLAEVVSEFCAATSFETAITRWTPDLLEEVGGIAEGAGIAVKTALAYNFLDEWCWFSAERYKTEPTNAGCSTIGLRSGVNGHPVVAQTHDLTAGHDGTQAILRIHGANGIRALVFTSAGMIALSGCNDRGVSINCNSLVHALEHSDVGMPVAFLIRGVLAQPTLAAARAFVEEVPHASGQSYLLGGPDGICNLECSAEKIVEARVGSSLVLHTNHPILQPDRSAIAHREAVSNSRARLAFLESRRHMLRSLEDVRETLENPAVCKREALLYSVAAIAAELSVPPRVFMTAGPPDCNPWLDIPFRKSHQ